MNALVELAARLAVDEHLDTRRLTRPEYELVVGMLLDPTGHEALPEGFHVSVGPIPRSREELVSNGGSWLPCEGKPAA